MRQSTVLGWVLIGGLAGLLACDHNEAVIEVESILVEVDASQRAPAPLPEPTALDCPVELLLSDLHGGAFSAEPQTMLGGDEVYRVDIPGDEACVACDHQDLQSTCAHAYDGQDP